MKRPIIKRVIKEKSNPWYEQLQKVISFPSENEDQIFYSIKPTDYVAVLAQLDDGRIIIVRQYRPAIEEFVYELPSGHIEKDESPEEAAIRELKEETNLLARRMIMLGENYPDTGRLENRQWAFYTNDVEPDPVEGLGNKEDIEVKAITVEELFSMINKGHFRHSLDLCVVAQAVARGYLNYDCQKR
jgi:ADP-ribose pyrophosphatase